MTPVFAPGRIAATRARALIAAAFALPAALLCQPAAAEAQSGSPWLRVTAEVVPVLSHADAIPGGGTLTEIRVVQPLLMLHGGAWRDLLRFTGTLNLEGWTLADGELSPGSWGEGFVDRRHPHTYVHELLLSAVLPLSAAHRAAASLAIGKGFVPFGTDDPMVRPPLRYPVNHHWSQILERAVGIAAVRAGPVVLEAALFNGDEPERPDQWPLWSRFGDSWSARLLVMPLDVVELQASRAAVASPEHRLGAGGRHDKWSASARLERALMSDQRVYVLAEWARSAELDGFFIFHTLLAEGSWRRGPHAPYYRFERTDRPEEEREPDLFRTRRPHHENSILGTTRWTQHTAGYRATFALRHAFSVGPFAEVTRSRIGRVGGGLFDPELFYGTDVIWSANVGISVAWGGPMGRMGRYGVLAGHLHDAEPHGPSEHDDAHDHDHEAESRR